jgi:hypothetical protein
MKRLVPAVLAACLLAALAASPAGAAAPKVKSCDPPRKPAGGKKKPEPCGGSGKREAENGLANLPKTWHIVAVDVKGEVTALDESPDYEFAMTGSSRIRGAGGRAGSFELAEPGFATATFGPVKTEVVSDAEWSDEQAGTYDCDMELPAAALPRTFTIGAVPSRKFRNAMLMRFNFFPAGWQDCRRGDERVPAPAPPPAPSDLMTATYPAAPFRDAPRGAKLKLVVNLDRTWSDGEIVVNQSWTGTITLRNTEALA